MVHSVTIRKEIADRVLQRRGRYHLFDRLDPVRTALVAIDMQNTFCAPGAPAEVPAARGIVEPINILTAGLRALRVPVIWVLHANERIGGKSDWELFFNTIVADEVRERTIESLVPAKQSVWDGLLTSPADRTVLKNRYSALIPGSSPLERMLRGLGIDTILIADQCVLRINRTRCHDARLQGCAGRGLLRCSLRRRASQRLGKRHPAVW